MKRLIFDDAKFNTFIGQLVEEVGVSSEEDDLENILNFSSKQLCKSKDKLNLSHVSTSFYLEIMKTGLFFGGIDLGAFTDGLPVRLSHMMNSKTGEHVIVGGVFDMKHKDGRDHFIVL